MKPIRPLTGASLKPSARDADTTDTACRSDRYLSTENRKTYNRTRKIITFLDNEIRSLKEENSTWKSSIPKNEQIE